MKWKEKVINSTFRKREGSRKNAYFKLQTLYVCLRNQEKKVRGNKRFMSWFVIQSYMLQWASTVPLRFETISKYLDNTWKGQNFFMGKSLYPYVCKAGLYVAFMDKAFILKILICEKHPNFVNLADTYGYRTYFDMIDLRCSGIDTLLI